MPNVFDSLKRRNVQKRYASIVNDEEEPRAVEEVPRVAVGGFDSAAIRNAAQYVNPERRVAPAAPVAVEPAATQVALDPGPPAPAAQEYPTLTPYVAPAQAPAMPDFVAEEERRQRVAALEAFRKSAGGLTQRLQSLYGKYWGQ